MQQYKFRGKRKDNGEWVEGNLSVEYDGACHIAYWASECTDHSVNLWEPVEKWHEVIPETVGQYTAHELGLYVGDIVNYVTGNPKRYVNAVVKFGEYETYTHFNKEEGDVEHHTGFYINDGDSKMPLRSLWLAKIGNIHDNPELTPLKGERINTMLDPNLKAASDQDAGNEQATQEGAAVESEAQDTAMEAAQDSEEGSTEG